jgi:Uncharacterized protein conserved in bacteria (DUF2325)
MPCAVIGTCLAGDDLLAIARRQGLEIPANATAYEVHGFFVTEATTATPLARAVAKVLDQRFEGMIRKASRAGCPHELMSLWQTERDAGRVAAVFWAVLTSPLATDNLSATVFGDVHMLSHLQGRSTHQLAAKASDLDAKVADLAQRLARETERHATALAERDAEIDRVRSLHCAAVASSMLRQVAAPKPSTRDDRREQHRDRALTAARERARAAEAEVAALRDAVHRLEVPVAHAALGSRTTAPACPAAVTLDSQVEADRRRVLYLGGRPSAIEQLRAIARDANADFVHHDGGIEHASHRIEGLVEGCDAVFCPVDCVSHAACLRAKAYCRKYNKRFVPLRSSGATSFARALEHLATP